MLQSIKLLRNVGQFDSVNAGAQLPFSKFTVVYAENGRGKTTLAAILRSIGTGIPDLIAERQRLGSSHPPHVVLNFAGADHIFQNGSWSGPRPRLLIFDDAFVADNICSGIEIETTHRQKLHELILGAEGVNLNSALQRLVEQVEAHNRSLRTKGDSIPVALRGSLTVEAFCALPFNQKISEEIRETETNLAAAKAAGTILSQPLFSATELPSFDIRAINVLLARSITELESEAARQVQPHLAKLGKDSASWVSDGMDRIAGASRNLDYQVCPFCAQNLKGSPFIAYYQAYFSAAYSNLKNDIIETGLSIKAAHDGDIPAAFERSVRVAQQNREFWVKFTPIPEAEIDTAEIALAWKEARESVLVALRAKVGSPLDSVQLPKSTLSAITKYHELKHVADEKLRKLKNCNDAIAVVKEKTATANVAALTAHLQSLKLVQNRQSEQANPLCANYLEEKNRKAQTERKRDEARTALDRYRDRIFPHYEGAINEYLRRFNAGYRLGGVKPINSRSSSSCSYNVLINEVPVSITAAAGPSFRNTLSAGDRNTLALAFFFASLEVNPSQLSDCIVVIDDPMTSLDEHRSLTTIQEMRRLGDRVKQMVVLSHSKSFLCALWEGASGPTRCAIRINRAGVGFTLATWDVRQDCITENDRRHALVAEYLTSGDSATERAVATALRYLLEAFIRVAYPLAFPPGELFGPFINICQQRVGTPREILKQADIAELKSILDYANKFHHETNAAFETERVNGAELTDWARRTIQFARRPRS